MTIAEWCIKNNRISGLLFILLFLGGILSLLNIGKQEYPEISVKSAIITTAFPGASPIKVEELLTKKIEDELSSISEIEYIRSQSLPGLSVIQADLYEKYRDVKPIWDRLRNKVDDATRYLPEGASKPFVNDEFGDNFPVVIALTTDGFSFRDLKDVAEDFRDELLTLPRVAKVEIHGIQEERIFIEFSNSKLAKFGYTPSELASALKSENIVKPSGDIKFQSERIIFEASGNYDNLDKLRKTTLRLPNSESAIQLDDLVDIKRAYIDPPSSVARYNGKRALSVAVNMVDGENILKMGKDVKQLLKEFELNVPIGINFDMAVYQADFVKRSLLDFIVNLLEAFIFVLVVVLFFVGLRMGLIVGSLIPMAICACMLVLPFFNLDLQMISVAALIIALGMLVDNAVVVSENIVVRLNNGEEKMEAINAAIKELTIPLLAASLTTIFAFLPIAMAKSNVGEFSFSLFVVITTALIASWLFSISMIPMLCYYFLKPTAQKEQSFDTPMYLKYRKLLFAALKEPYKFIGIVFLLFVLSLWGFKYVDKNFFPPNEREMFTIDYWQPYGTDIIDTENRLAELEDFILKDDEGVSIMSYVGAGGPRWYQPLSPEDPKPNYALTVVTTKSYKGAFGLIDRVRDFIATKMQEVRASVSLLQNGPPVKTPIEIRISGDDIPTLYSIRGEIESYLRAEKGVINIRDDWGEWTKKVFVDINQDKAKRAGLSSEDVALSLQTQFTGLQATEFRDGDEIIPIVLRSKSYYRKNAGNIEDINVYSSYNGNNVPLSQVADIKLQWQASNIRGRNRERTITLKADLNQGYFATAILAAVKKKIDKYTASEKWPNGYKIQFGGENEKSSKAKASIVTGLPLAFCLLLLVLMYQFNSVRKVGIIFLTIPPMLIGVTPGLYFTKSPFGFFALLGFISLFGIIVNNAIMMIDRIDIEIASGRSIGDAIISASEQRLRPILMTAVTTTIGLIPLSLQGGEMWRPMANTIIFGLIFSTVLTLVFCPLLYGLFYGAKYKFDEPAA